MDDKHKHLLLLVKSHKARLFIAMACMIAISASTAASAYLLKNVIDDIFIDRNLFMLKFIPMLVVCVFLVRGLGMLGQEYFMNYVGERIVTQLRNELYSHIQNMSLSFFFREKTGTLMSRITYDVNIIKTMVSSSVTGVVRDSFTIIFLTLVIFIRDWKTALIAFIIFPLAFYPVVAIGRRVRKVSTGVQETMADLNSFLHETFSGSKIVKAFGMESYETRRFCEKTDNLFQIEMKSVVARSLSSPVMEVLGGVGIAFVIWYGGYKVFNGTSTPGTFFSFMAAVLMLYDPVKKLSHLNNSIQQGLAATDRIFSILERDSDIGEEKNPVVLESKPHRVAFRDVSLKYGETEVLKEINLDVSEGEILALVGMSGGGKTSLVNLIPRFYDVSHGSVEIDDIDIKKVSIKSLRRQTAIVTQEPILFNDTVGNNIAYGKRDATSKEIEAAAKAANAYDFIQSFTEGFDTVIGELGGRLSGGEKQRICIARALLKNAPILILDEATSALDTESESLVQGALENLMKGRTTFIIAHRLSTIGHADRIVVIVDGRIVEEGKHENLMARRGAYFKLNQMQFGNDRNINNKTG
jgi:ATP-binding cassette, subfamily B, bacterial MsbA